MEAFKNSLYPERPSEHISEGVGKLREIISGEVPSWEMTPEEHGEVLETDEALEQEFSEIRAIMPRNVSFDFSYLLTEEGKTDFESTSKISIPTEITDFDSLKIFLYNHTDTLKDAPQKELTALGGRSNMYRRKEIFNALKSTLQDDGSIDTSHIPSGDSVNIRLEPVEDFKKTEQLREFKVKIKKLRTELETVSTSSGQTAVLDGLYTHYQKRVNEMLALRAEVFVSLQKKADLLGYEALSLDELRALDESMIPAQNTTRGLSRYDKFLYGSGSESNENGDYEQITAELLTFAEEEESRNLEVLSSKKESIESRNIDPEKLSAVDIPPETVAEYCMKTLRHYDLLSEVPSETYSPDRPGPASDGKWQVIVSDSFPHLQVNGQQKILKCPNKKQSIDRLLSVTIAHEIEGHVLQHTNRSKIPLKFFESIGSDRSAIFAEAGAMHNQDHITQEAFGYKSPSLPQYIKAMATKLKGGSYADCVKSYYESTIRVYKQQLERGEIDQETFKKECSRRLRTAVGSTARLFHGDLNSTDTSTGLTRSKDTVYLEQLRLAAELKNSDLEEFLYLTGVNLDSMEFLLRSKMLDITDIQKPDFYALDIWNDVKQNYALEE